VTETCILNYICVAINEIKHDKVHRIRSKLLFDANSQIIQHCTEGQE